MRTRLQIVCALLISAALLAQTGAKPRVIEIVADKDSRFKIEGHAAPVVRVTAGEALVLRITAIKAKNAARDGSVHGLALLDSSETAVPGWKFYLHPGVQEFAVTAPAKPGKYTAVCTVICSDGHEDMEFTLLVEAAGTAKQENKQ